MSTPFNPSLLNGVGPSPAQLRQQELFDRVSALLLGGQFAGSNLTPPIPPALFNLIALDVLVFSLSAQRPEETAAFVAALLRVLTETEPVQANVARHSMLAARQALFKALTASPTPEAV